MKSKILLIMLFVSFSFLSCDKGDEYDIDESLESSSLLFPIANNDDGNGYIIAALVDEGSCGAPRRNYSVYASSGLTKKNYDREIHVGISSGSNLVDAKILKIPANSTKSENKLVFNYPLGSIDNVRIKIYTVLKGGTDVTSLFQLRETTYNNIQYCFENVSNSGPCVGLEDITDSPNASNDDDNDGLCNESDPDDNNNGIPDISED